MARVRWTYDASKTVDHFLVAKKSRTEDAYGTALDISYSVGGPNRDKKGFFIDDADGQPGDCYRITAVGPEGEDVSFTIIPPPPPPTCLVVGFIYNPNGTPAEGAKVFVSTPLDSSAKLSKLSSGVSGSGVKNVAMTTVITTVVTDENGMFQTSLLQGAPVKISIPSLPITRAFIVPQKLGPMNFLEVQQIVGRDFDQLWPEATGEPPFIPVA